MTKLTDKLVKAAPAPPPGRANAITYDGEVKGFGVRVTQRGARSFVLNYRVGGRERRLTIGAYPDWPVAAARDEAKRLKREIDNGRDPLAERQAMREAPTVNDLANRYLAEHAIRKRERSRREDQALIRQWIAPELGSLRVAEIRHADIDGLHRKITASGTATRANRTIALVSRMLTLAIRWEWRVDNPAAGIERNQEQPRVRYLSGDELRRLTAALSAHSHPAAANAVRLLLLTGARRTEVLAATWDQFDLGAGVWTKPSSTLSSDESIASPCRRRRANCSPTCGSRASAGPWPDTNCHICSRPAPATRTWPTSRKVWASICRAAGLSGVRLHDIRHSYASILASAGLSLPVIGALLGHTQASTTQRYAHLFDDPLRAATERVGAVVTGVDKPGDVVPIRRR